MLSETLNLDLVASFQISEPVLANAHIHIGCFCECHGRRTARFGFCELEPVVLNLECVFFCEGAVLLGVLREAKRTPWTLKLPIKIGYYS